MKILFAEHQHRKFVGNHSGVSWRNSVCSKQCSRSIQCAYSSAVVWSGDDISEEGNNHSVKEDDTSLYEYDSSTSTVLSKVPMTHSASRQAVEWSVQFLVVPVSWLTCLYRLVPPRNLQNPFIRCPDNLNKFVFPMKTGTRNNA